MLKPIVSDAVWHLCGIKTTQMLTAAGKNSIFSFVFFCCVLLQISFCALFSLQDRLFCMACAGQLRGDGWYGHVQLAAVCTCVCCYVFLFFGSCPFLFYNC